jgi:diguanylate cyclase (GGDEF)-like protein
MHNHSEKLLHKDIINAKVEIALVENIYQQARIGFAVSIICSTMVVIFSLYANTDITILFTWYFAFIMVVLARIILYKLFIERTRKKTHIKIWRNLFTVGALLGGIMWGFTGTSFFLPVHASLEQTFILVILAGITAGAVPLNSHISETAIIFLLAALLPLVVHFFSFSNTLYLLFDFTILVFAASLILLVFKTHRFIYDALFLRFENDDLLIELKSAKEQLEITNKRLQQEATHDPLTHVANRHLFEVILQDALNQAERKKQNLALFYMDLDKFKEVNDTYGHHAGDQLLLVVISRIKNILRDTDTVARLGGDEITIILENATHLEKIAEIADRICKSIAKPIKVDGTDTHVFASIGISMYPSDGTDIKKLIAVADKAMYFVKENGGNSFHFNLDAKDV